MRGRENAQSEDPEVGESAYEDPHGALKSWLMHLNFSLNERGNH